MNHPDLSQWSLFASGDSSPEEHAELQKHREQCPECAVQVAALERTVGKLEAWDFPRTQPRPTKANDRPPFVRYGLAASLMLGLGVAIGRLSSAPNEGVLKAQLAADWRNEFERSRAESRAEIAALEAWLKETAFDERQSTLRQVATAINLSREQDRTAIANEFANLRREQLANIHWLRRDLETLASRADDEISATQAHLRKLVVSSQPPPKP